MSSRRAGGRPPKKQWCRIFFWLEGKDPDLAAIYREHCLEMKLHPRFDDAGVTFLYPEDAGFREAIKKAAEDDTAEATRLLSSLVLLNFFGSAADFARLEAGTLARTKYKAAPKGEGVELEGGATARPDKEFAPTKELEGRIAVWALKGRPALPTEPFTPVRRTRPEGDGPGARPRKPPTTGGALGDGASAVRVAFAERVLAAAALGLPEDAPGPGRRPPPSGRDPFLDACVVILGALERADPGRLAAVVPLLDFCPVATFFLLVEPWKTGEGHLVPEAVLAEYAGLGAGAGPDAAVAAFCSYFRDWTQGGAARLGAVFAEKDRLRADAIDRGSCSDAVLEAYDRLVAENALGPLSGVLPAETCALLRAPAPARPGLRKLHGDELRFHIVSVLTEARGEGGLTRGGLEGLANFVRVNMPGNDYAAEVHMVQPAPSGAGAREWRRELLTSATLFTNSTCFLCTSVPPAFAGTKCKDPEGSGALWDLKNCYYYNHYCACLGWLCPGGPPGVRGGAERMSAGLAAALGAARAAGGPPPPDLLDAVRDWEAAAGAGAGDSD